MQHSFFQQENILQVVPLFLMYLFRFFFWQPTRPPHLNKSNFCLSCLFMRRWIWCTWVTLCLCASLYVNFGYLIYLCIPQKSRDAITFIFLEDCKTQFVQVFIKKKKIVSSFGFHYILYKNTRHNISFPFLPSSFVWRLCTIAFLRYNAFSPS